MKLTKRVLYHKAKTAQFKWPWKNQQLAQHMLYLMRSSQGIGLAAPQCGVSVRLFVMEINNWSRCCFNPEITACSQDLVEYNEGCLSFPGDQCIITRPRWIEVKYQDHRGDWHTETLEDLPARCFQHELDHLDGITMWQRHKEQNAEQS
jgi:peptide deformylase